MNPPAPGSAGRRTSIPAYSKWDFGAAAKTTPLKKRTTPEPSPLPFEAIHEHDERTAGPPSTSADGHSAGGTFTIPEGADGKTNYGTCSLFLGVDDWGSLEVKDSGGKVVAQVDLKENPQTAGAQGGHKYHTGVGGVQLPSGTYSWQVNQTDIDYKPESGNTSICNYSIDVVPTEPGGQKNPEPCPCQGNTCDNSGGTPPSPSLARSGPETGVRNSTLGDYSSAGCSVNAESTATLMYWSCNFGAFRGLEGLPAGRVELRAEKTVSGLGSPVALAYNHPLNSRLDVPEGGIVPGARFNLVQGDRVIAMRCYTNGSVLPIGVDTSGGGRATLATVEGQSCLRWVVEDGSQYLFLAETGQLLSYTTTDKQVISNATTYLDVKHAEDGSLRQLWNLWDGLLNVENVTATGYTIALYTPGQITGTDEQGFYTVTGTPFKTFVLSLFTDGQFTVTEQAPARQPYIVTWWKNGQAWNMRRGTGEDAITTTRTRTELEAEDSVWQLVTEISKGGIVAARTCSIYQTTDVGDLLLTMVEGYESPEEQTTQYAYDQCGRLKTETAPNGSQIHYTYDLYGRLGRTVSVTDVLGRVTAYAYSGDGLTATRTAPSGATFVTRSAPDGTVLEESGTGQRHVIYAIDLVNDGVRTFTKAVSGETETELQRSIVNGAGETLRTGVPNTVGGVIYTRRTYNAKGQLVKEQTDAGNAATTMAPTLWEYDAFGNRTKETWKLADPATVSNSRITTWSYGAEQAEDGVYQVVTATRNNGRGTTCDETQKTLLSSLSSTLESKDISIDPRGNISTQWSEYGAGALRMQKSSIPTSDLTATATVIDGVATSQTDHVGIVTSQTRAYTETGIIYASTNGRGNTTTTQTDLAGRTVSVTDAAGNTTSTAYGPWFDQPSVVTNALGNTTCYGYDLRGRNTAQWGTGTQPLLFAYDEADRMTSLTTFREDAGDITTDPAGRTDGDVTTWNYDDATGLLIRKTWADGTHEDTTYNALNFRSTLTDARGVVTTWGYNLKKGVNNSISYSDSTPGIQYAYNYLNQLTLVTDASGSRTIAYNQYNEPDTDSITIEGCSYQVQEHYDTYGRSSGYALTQGTGVLQEVSQGYADDGRLASAGIRHGGKNRHSPTATWREAAFSPASRCPTASPGNLPMKNTATWQQPSTIIWEKPCRSPAPRVTMHWDARPSTRSGGERSLPAATASATTAETSSPELLWAPPPTVTDTTTSATARRRRNWPKNSPSRPTNSTSIPALKKTRRRLLHLNTTHRATRP